MTEATKSSISELHIELKRAEDRADTMANELTEFLEAIGARSLTDALERHRRFATIAIESPKNIEKLQVECAQLNKMYATQSSLVSKLQTQAGTLRTELNRAYGLNQNDTNNSRAIRAALELCVDAFTSPIFSQFKRETDIILRSVQAALRTLSPVTETNVDAEIHSA